MAARDAADLEKRRLLGEKAKVVNRRKRLMESIYAGAVPLEEIAGEQEKLSRQLANVEERLANLSGETTRVEDGLSRALDLASNCHQAYRGAPDDLRRLMNQAFFEKPYIEDDSVVSRMHEPFATISQVATQGSAKAKTPGTLSVSGGLPSSTLQAIPAGEGSRVLTLAPPAGFEPAAPGTGNQCSIP